MLKRQPETLLLAACLILTTVPAALGTPGAPAAYALEEYTTVTDQGAINGTILMNSTEQENEAENVVINDQTNSGEVYINNTTVTETMPEEGYETEYSQINHEEVYYDGTTISETVSDEGFDTENDQMNHEEVYYDNTSVTETAPEKDFETRYADDSVIDNRLREAAPNTVYKEKSYLDIGDRPGIGKYRELLLFDLSEYSNTENISSATLSLYWFYPDGKERPTDTIIEVYRPAAAWNPENVTWNSRDRDVLWIQPGGDWFDRNKVPQGDAPYATITLKASDLPDNRYYELDVTDLVKEYVSGRYENTGFLIKTRIESADYVAFYSSNNENEKQHPKLNIKEA